MGSVNAATGISSFLGSVISALAVAQQAVQGSRSPHSLGRLLVWRGGLEGTCLSGETRALYSSS